MQNTSDTNIAKRKAFAISILSFLLGILGIGIFIDIGVNYLPHLVIGSFYGYEAYGLLGFGTGIAVGIILGSFVISRGLLTQVESFLGVIIFAIIFSLLGEALFEGGFFFGNTFGSLAGLYLVQGLQKKSFSDYSILGAAIGFIFVILVSPHLPSSYGVAYAGLAILLFLATPVLTIGLPLISATEELNHSAKKTQMKAAIFYAKYSE